MRYCRPGLLHGWWKPAWSKFAIKSKEKFIWLMQTNPYVDLKGYNCKKWSTTLWQIIVNCFLFLFNLLSDKERCYKYIEKANYGHGGRYSIILQKFRINHNLEEFRSLRHSWPQQCYCNCGTSHSSCLMETRNILIVITLIFIEAI